MQLYENVEVAKVLDEAKIQDLLKNGYEPFLAFPAVRTDGYKTWVDHYFYFRKPVNRKKKSK